MYVCMYVCMSTQTHALMLSDAHWCLICEHPVCAFVYTGVTRFCDRIAVSGRRFSDSIFNRRPPRRCMPKAPSSQTPFRRVEAHEFRQHPGPLEVDCGECQRSGRVRCPEVSERTSGRHVSVSSLCVSVQMPLPPKVTRRPRRSHRLLEPPIATPFASTNAALPRKVERAERRQLRTFNVLEFVKNSSTTSKKAGETNLKVMVKNPKDTKAKPKLFSLLAVARTS